MNPEWTMFKRTIGRQDSHKHMIVCPVKQNAPCALVFKFKANQLTRLCVQQIF